MMGTMTAPPTELRTARDVGEAILAAKQRPMDKATSEALLRLIVAGDGFTLPEKLPLALEIAKYRCAEHNIPVSDGTLMMLGLLCDRPATIVLYCVALKTIADRVGHAVTVSDLCEAFPWGFPDEAALAAIWDRQKAHDGNGSDNRLDRSEAWQ